VEPTSVKYRPDIDGLRALAILPVIWFHSDLPGLPGGFTGVDTFFVISGYLITAIIHREVAAGQFSFARFYERRVRRIAPALLLVAAASTATAFALLLPYELERFGWSVLAALAMVSNVYFWLTGGYFALAESITPMLHTWSLGVEEQFYLFFPIFLIVAERLRITRLAILAIGLASFVLCLIGTAQSPAATFYLLPTRGWELMIGGALAVQPVRVPRFAGLVGVAALIIAAVAITGDDPFPGWRALLPAVGAALVIASGKDSPSGRLLSAPPLVGIGKISYSLYLWHWPIFAFMRHWRADTALPPWASAFGIALALLAASASYRWVEQPARRRSLLYRKVVVASASAMLVIAVAAAAAVLGRGLPQRLDGRVAALAAGHEAFAPLAHACTDTGFEEAVQRCRLGVGGAPQFVLWGDSHAAALSEGVAKGLDRPGLVFSMGACPATSGWLSRKLKGRDPATCRDFNARVLDYVEHSPTVQTVVLSSYWAALAQEEQQPFWRSVEALVAELRSHGKSVIVVAGVPDPGVDVPWASAIRQRFGRELVQLTCPRPSVPLRGVTVVDVSGPFCGEPAARLFTDSNHVSRYAGLKIVAPAVREAVGFGQSRDQQ
jgi:peptidoglycan/LPS O-acetylase OafA/YrhL